MAEPLVQASEYQFHYNKTQAEACCLYRPCDSEMGIAFSVSPKYFHAGTKLDSNTHTYICIALVAYVPFGVGSLHKADCSHLYLSWLSSMYRTAPIYSPGRNIYGLSYLSDRSVFVSILAEGVYMAYLPSRTGGLCLLYLPSSFVGT